MSYPRYEIVQNNMVLVLPLKININTKAQTVEEIISKRYDMHIACFRFLVDELRHELTETTLDLKYQERFECDISKLFLPKNYKITGFADHISKQVDEVLTRHSNCNPSDFLDYKQYKQHVVEMLDTGDFARSKLQHYLKDRNQYLWNFLDYPLNASHFLHVGFVEDSLNDNKSNEESQRLCELKGLFSIPCYNGGNCLISAAALGLSSKDLRLLATVKDKNDLDKSIVDVNAKDCFGYSAISMAAMNGHEHALQTLLELKADINTIAKNGATPIILAASNGHLRCVSILLNNKADYYPAIAVAIGTRKREIVLLLLKQASAGSTSISLSKFKSICYSSLKQILNSESVCSELLSCIR